MANKTVYPYGTGGQLPSSIGLVNDLKTGGVDKALTAEQGKVLDGKIPYAVLPALNTTSDKVIKVADGTEATSQNTIIASYSIDPSKKYFASGRLFSNALYCSVAYYNGNTYIGHQQDGGTVSKAEDFVRFELTIPSNATIVKVIGNINAQIPVLEEPIAQTVKDIQDSQYIELVETGVVYGKVPSKNNGSLIDATNGVLKSYQIEYGREYYATGRQLTPSSVCSIAYFHDETFISSEKNGGVLSVAENFEKYKLTVPQNATVVKVYGSSTAQAPYLYMSEQSAVEQLQQNSQTQHRSFVGKKLSVIGDSISTIYGGNTPYWTVKSVDVGNTIQSYVTWEDIYGNYRYPDTSHPTGKTIGGVTLTLEMVDGELHSFTPVLADVGKEIGVPHHYSGNDASVKVWSQRLCEMTGMELLANASWSGSAITSMEVEGRGIDFTSSHAWHPCTIGRCRVRDDSGNFVNPDVIIIYRGTNDFSYANNGNYPTLQITDVSLLDGFSATTDKVADSTYNFRIGYYLTIKALRQAYPNAIIYLCTLNVFKRVHYDKWPTRNDAFTLPDISNVIREIANVTGCGLIELDKDGITFENCYPTYISDSATIPTHPNGNGHRVMAEKAIADLTYALNPTA